MSLVFHLPGRHDQLSHGRRGPGKLPQGLKDDMREAASRMIPSSPGEDGGFTYEPGGRLFPTRGLAVSPFPERTEILAGVASPAQLTRYFLSNRDMWAAYPGVAHFGGWYENSTDRSHLDVSLVVGDHPTAMRLARERNQLSYFDLESFKYYKPDGTELYSEEGPMDIESLRVALAERLRSELDLELRQLYPGSLIAAREQEIFALDYQLDLATGTLTLTEPRPVELVYRDPADGRIVFSALEGTILEEAEEAEAYGDPTGGDLHVDGLIPSPPRPKACAEADCGACEEERKRGCDYHKRLAERDAVEAALEILSFHLGARHDQKVHGRRGPGAAPTAKAGDKNEEDGSALGRADKLAAKLPDKGAEGRAKSLYTRFREFHYNHPIIASYLTTTAIRLVVTASLVAGLNVMGVGMAAGAAAGAGYYVPPAIMAAEKPKKKGDDEPQGPTPEDLARLCDDFERQLDKVQAQASSGEHRARIRASEGDGGEEEDSGSYRLFLEAEQAFAERSAPDWIPFLPKPGSYSHPKFGKIALTKERIASFINNFKEGIYQKMIPLDAEHQTKLSGAAAWITDLRENPDGSADARVEWTDRGKVFLENDRFRYISPEWYDRWTDPATGRDFRNVIVGGALTTRPFFKDGSLRPLIASEEAWFSPGDEDELLAGAEGDPGAQPGTTDGQGQTSSTGGNTVAEEGKVEGTTLSGDETARQFAEMQAKTEELEKALKSATEVAEAQARELKAAAEELKTIRLESRRKAFHEAVMGAEDGPRWFGEPEKHVSFMEAITDAFGEESEEMAWYRTLNKAFAEQVRTGGLFSEAGTVQRGGTVSDGEQLRALTEARMKERGLDYAQAFREVAAENAETYRRYIEATQGRV